MNETARLCRYREPTLTLLKNEARNECDDQNLSPVSVCRSRTTLLVVLVRFFFFFGVLAPKSSLLQLEGRQNTTRRPRPIG